MAKSKKKRKWQEGQRRTLVLSSSYEVINFVNELDAVICAFKGRADVLSTWDLTLSTPSRKIEIPSVLRLKHAHHRKNGPVRFHKIVMFRRDNWTCQYCGRGVTRSTATIEHIVPECQGGPTTYKNCVTACKPCNQKKRNRTPEEAGMTLLSKPEQPSLLHVYNIGRDSWHPSWDEYIGYLRT